MNKKIKVIELIKRINENKDVPKKIKYNNIEFWYENAIQDYCSTDDRCTYLFKKITELPTKWLNVKVDEILEDEEEIDIQDIKYEYNEHAKNIINNLIKDGYELEGIKESIEEMINYIESIKEKNSHKKAKKIKKTQNLLKIFKKSAKI